MNIITTFLQDNPTIKLFIQVAIYVIPLVIASIYAYKDFKGKSKKINLIGWFVIILLILSFVAATINFVFTSTEEEQEKLSRKQELKSVKDTLSGEISSSKIDLKKEIIELKIENDNLRKELNSSSINLNKFLRGSDFRQITVELYKYKKGQLHFYISNKSNLPLYDAGLSFQDYDELKKCKTSKARDSIVIPGECYYNAIIGVEHHFFLNPNSSTTSTPFPESDSNGDLHFAFYLTTRNTSSTRFCVFRKTGQNKYVQSYRVYDSFGKILDKGKDPLKLGEKFWKEYFYVDNKITLEKVEN